MLWSCSCCSVAPVLFGPDYRPVLSQELYLPSLVIHTFFVKYARNDAAPRLVSIRCSVGFEGW